VTKYEVHFLHEDTVIETIQRPVDSRLLAANAPRTHYMNSLRTASLEYMSVYTTG